MAMALPAWVERPSKTLYIIYLREDVPSEAILRLAQKACVDHGLKVEAGADNMSMKAESTVAKKKFNLTFRTGRHAIKGNMLAMEYDDHSLEKAAVVVGAIALTLVVVVAVVGLAVVLSGGNSSGNGGGSGCHHSSSFNFVSLNLGYGGYEKPSSRGRVKGFKAGKPLQVAEFERRRDFFSYFFENVSNLLANYGLVRVPDEAAVKFQAYPLTSLAVREHTLGLLDSHMFCFTVTQEDVDMNRTLQIDVVATAACTLRARHNAAPSRLSRKTVSADTVGNFSYALQIGSALDKGARRKLEPGHWVISVTNANPIARVSFKIGAMLFEDTEKHYTNPELFGVFTTREAEGEGLDDWEVVDVAAAASEPVVGEARAAMTLVDLPPAQRALTRDTNLLELSEAQLQEELRMRGMEFRPEAGKRELAGVLFPVLPLPYEAAAAPARVVASNGGKHKQTDLDAAAAAAAPVTAQPVALTPTAPVLDGIEPAQPSAPPLPCLRAGGSAAAGSSSAQQVYDTRVPDELTCPITCDLMLEPVIAADGHSYDEAAIVQWLSSHDTSPMTGLVLKHKELIPNFSLRSIAEAWREGHLLAAGPTTAL